MGLFHTFVRKSNIKMVRNGRPYRSGRFRHKIDLVPMNIHKITLLFTGALLAAAPFLAAADAKFSERGHCVFSDDFSGTAMDKGWAGKPGKWEMVDGVVKVSQVKEDNHAAVRRHPLKPYHDGIFEMSFEFDGATTTGISLNNKGGHVCRVDDLPKGMLLTVDQPNHDSPLEVRKIGGLDGAGGIRHVAQAGDGSPWPGDDRALDDAPPITGENPRVDVEKTDVGIRVGGVYAKIKGFKVYAIK